MPLPERGTPEWISEVGRLDGTFKGMYADANARHSLGDKGAIIYYDLQTSEKFFILVDIGPVVSATGDWELEILITPPGILKPDVRLRDLLEGASLAQEPVLPLVCNSPIIEELCRQYPFVDNGNGHITLTRSGRPIEVFRADEPKL